MSYPRASRTGLFIGLGIGCVAVGAIVLALITALSPGATAPKDVAASYIASSAGHDIDELKDASCANDQQFIDKHAKTLEPFAGPSGSGPKFSVGKADIAGDTAKVPATINNEEYTFRLVREDASWKVCFDYNDLL